MHNINATADVNPYNGIPAILGQHKACAQIAMIMNGRGLSPPPPFGLRSLYTHTSYHLTWHTAPMMHRSHKLATMLSYSGCPLRLFPNEPSRIRLCRTVPRMLAYLATTWHSRQYLLLTIPERQTRLDPHVRHFEHDFWQQECENSALRGTLAKFSQNEIMHPALVHTVPTPPRRSEPP